MKTMDAIKQAEREYQAGAAAKICGVATRTVSSWCEKGLLVAETEGRGDRRKFTALQVVEIAIIAGLSDAGMSSKRISKAMRFIRGERGARLKYALAHDHSFLIVPIEEPTTGITTAVSRFIRYWNDGDKADDTEKQEVLENLFHHDTDRTLILNIGRIAERVAAKL